MVFPRLEGHPGVPTLPRYSRCEPENKANRQRLISVGSDARHYAELRQYLEKARSLEVNETALLVNPSNPALHRRQHPRPRKQELHISRATDALNTNQEITITTLLLPSRNIILSHDLVIAVHCLPTLKTIG